MPNGHLPTGIDYTPGELRLRGVTLAPEDETALFARIQAAGYQARVNDGILVLRSEGNP